ncbi:MAG: FG-GAP repeat protein, partial [Blastocatellia bacterium]|nr:FG-GAP repeat protein [Blastocatellia bacterium]
MTTLGKTFAALLRQPARFLTITLLFLGFALGMVYRHSGHASQDNNSTRKIIASLPSHALSGALGEAVGGEALSAARYHLNEVRAANGAKSLEAVNPAQSLRASFTGADVQVHSGNACQTPWQLGLTLKGVKYGTTWQAVRPGVLSAQGNRVDIVRDTISEWYLNKPEGLEQGFTLKARPTTSTPTTDELRVVMELSAGWKATLEKNQQAILLRQGTASLRYDKLLTIDATGRELPSRMEVNGNELALVVNDANAVWPITIDPTLTQQTQFVATNGASFDHFGTVVAISGDTAVVGAPDFDANSITNSGAVFVFVRTGSSWSQQAQLTASDAASYDSFGSSVAISGDTIVIGAYGDDNGFNSDQGSAYVFTRSGTTWSQQAKLTVSTGVANDWFGYSVAISGDTALIGAPLDDFGSTVNQGSAYVFTRSGVTWSQQEQLNATDAADSDNFGFAVALQGETAVIGAPADDVNSTSDQGSAYVFVRSSSTWSPQQQLSAGDGASGDLFGYAVAISGETAMVGAPQDDVNGNVNQGSAYVFVRSNATWSQQAMLTASDGTGGDTFGNSLAISNEMAVIGAPTNDVGGSPDQGSAYVFTRSGATWSQQQQLIASDGAGSDSLGSGVAISGFTAIVG